MAGGKPSRAASMKHVVFILLFIVGAISARPQLFVPSGVRFSKTAPSNVFTAASANGRYEVTVEETGLNSLTPSHIPLVATMLKVESNSRTPLWSAKFPGWQVQHFISSDFLFSDDGYFFVQTRGVSSTATLFRQDASFPLNLPNNLDFFLSFQEKYILLDQLNGQKIVRFWNRSKNSWEVINATTGQKFTNTIPNEVIAKWMEAQRREIIDRIYAAKREMLRRKVAESSPALGKLAANAMSQTANVVVTEGDYEFLTLQRHPEDRHWLEELFAYDDDSFSSFPFITPSSFYGGSAEKEGSLADFVQTDFISARVDRLLGIWDKKVSESAPPGMIGQADESKLTRYHLGKVFGRVQFSLPINVFTSLPKPPPAPGPMIHILLIPADRATSAASPITTESIDASLSVYRDRLAEVAGS